MRTSTGWLAVFGLLLALINGCGAGKDSVPSGPLPPKFAEEIAVDLLWNYEQTLRTGRGNPYQFVTGLEKQWLDQYLKERQAGTATGLGWRATGAVVKVNKVTAKEALLDSQFEMSGRTVTIQWKFVPVQGAWKISNHQLPSGKWWAPGAK